MTILTKHTGWFIHPGGALLLEHALRFAAAHHVHQLVAAMAPYFPRLWLGHRGRIIAELWAKRLPLDLVLVATERTVQHVRAASRAAHCQAAC